MRRPGSGAHALVYGEGVLEVLLGQRVVAAGSRQHPQVMGSRSPARAVGGEHVAIRRPPDGEGTSPFASPRQIPGAEVDEHRRGEGEAPAGAVQARASAGTAAVAPGAL